MQRVRRLVWITVVLFAILVLATFLYMKSEEAWQETYRRKVSQGMVNLLQDNPYDKTPVVLIVIDGLRWEEGIGAEDKYIPHIWNDLRPKGTLLTNYYIASPTVTTSSHAAMLTGRISPLPNDGHIRPVFPTFLELFRDARSDYLESTLREIIEPGAGLYRPNAQSRAEAERLASGAREFGPEKTALYLGKDLIYSLDQSSSGYCPDDDIFLKDSMRDIEVFEYFRAKVPDEKPNMVVVNLGDTDEAGHEAEWFFYVDTVRWADRLVWEMYQSLQELTRYRDKTIFIVTTDHGRHEPARGGYPHHGCFCEGCRRSFLLVLGPGIKQGFVSDQPHSELDVAPTIGRAIGFETPSATGSPIMEIFENPDSLPAPRETEVTRRLAQDVKRVDERDTSSLLLSTLIERTPQENLGSNEETALLLLAIASRIRNHPDEAGRWSDAVREIVQLPDEVTGPADLILGYPLMELGQALNMAGDPSGSEFQSKARDLLSLALAKGIINLQHPSYPVGMDTATTALFAAFMAALGMNDSDEGMSIMAVAAMLDILSRYEEAGKVYNIGLEDLIAKYRYREGPNEIFIRGEPTWRDRMWLLWGADRVVAETDPQLVPDLYPLLRQQARLLVACAQEWQDANAMVGGTGDLAEDVDFTAQGLCLAVAAEFKPWRRWELDELGYSPTIYATPLFDWPPAHFFYLLGQANTLAGSWAANERLKLFVEDDGTIRHDLLDKGAPLKPGDPGYFQTAAPLAYGLTRFEKADYGLYDLEIYPIVYQQENSSN
jgi:hypothetical protein